MAYPTKEEFAKAIKDARESFTDLELAKAFNVSLPTIKRWAKGTFYPHRLGRKPILNQLERMKGV